MREKSMVLLLFCLALSPFARAQSQGDAKDQPQGELTTLRSELTALQAEQRQIISRLDELKQLLQVNSHPPNSTTLTRLQLPSTLNIQGENSRGNSGARVAIIEYSDFECPYCGLFERETSPQIFTNYIETGEVKLVYRDLPLPMHPHAIQAARAARCADEQGKYWEMHDSLFAKQSTLSDPALLDRAKTLDLNTNKFGECFSSDKYKDDLLKGIAEAQKLGVQATPTFFIGTIDANGGVVNISKRIVGAKPYAEFHATLDEVLNSNSQQAVSGH